jgi:hypothetical protein
MSNNKVAPPVVDSKELLKELLRVAQDPGSTKQELSRAWKLTKSSKVRKAIAANPNADVDIMKMSARLYLQEVLGNTSFELMELFLDDPFIKQVQATYKSPPKSGRINFTHPVKHTDKEIITRAMLLSPQLTYDGLRHCSQVLPSAVFKRDMANSEVFKRCKTLVDAKFVAMKSSAIGKIRSIEDFSRLSNYSYKEIKMMFKFHELGLVDKLDIDNLIYRIGIANSHYGSDAVTTRYILSELIRGDTDDIAIDNATRAILVVGAETGIKKIWEKIIKEDVHLLKVRDKILRSFVKVLVNILDFSAVYGWDQIPYRLKETSEVLHGAIFDMVIRDRFKDIKKGKLLSFKTWDYEFIYGVFESIGFIKYASAWHQDKFHIYDPTSIVSLNSCKREVQEFFLLNNFLGKNLLISRDTSNLVSILDEFNENGSPQEMFYASIDLEYYKKICYSPDNLRVKSINHYGPAVTPSVISAGMPKSQPPVTPFTQRLLSGIP